MAERVYVQNHLKSLLLLQKNDKTILLKLAPLKCSNRAFDKDMLMEQNYVMSCLAKGYISFQPQPTVIVDNKYKKDVGQKYKIGTHLYIVGENNLTGTVDEYNPTTQEYKVKLDKTGGCPTFLEHELSLSPYEKKATEELPDEGTANINRSKKLEVASAPVQIIRQAAVEDKPIDFDVIDKQADSFSNTIESKTTGKIVRVKQQEEADGGTLLDTSNGAAEEIPLKVVSANKAQVEENLPESDNTASSAKTVAKVAPVVKSAPKKPTQAETLKQEFAELPEEMQEWFKEFAKNDDRTKKLIINEMEDMDKLEVIAKHGNYTAKKSAASRIEFLQS